MKELVEIPAECLRWCPYGFEFEAEWESEDEWEGAWDYSLINIDGCAVTFKKGGDTLGVHEFVLDENYKTVQVNPEEYTKAVVEHLKSVFNEPLKIWKSKRNDSIKIGNKYESLDVSIDPKPWLDEYTLEVADE